MHCKYFSKWMLGIYIVVQFFHIAKSISNSMWIKSQEVENTFLAPHSSSLEMVSSVGLHSSKKWSAWTI